MPICLVYTEWTILIHLELLHVHKIISIYVTASENLI